MFSALNRSLLPTLQQQTEQAKMKANLNLDEAEVLIFLQGLLEQ
jgi:hypothetical protein